MATFDKQHWLDKRWDYSKYGPTPAYDAQEAAVAVVLAGLERLDTIFEVGCGFGRITRVALSVSEARQYIASDVSAHALANAVEYLANENLGNGGELLLGTFDLDGDVNSNADFVNVTADLVICAEVLMHRTPHQVPLDIERLCKMARRYVLTVDWREPSDRYAAGCYQHNYERLFGEYGRVTVTPVPEARQAVFLTEIGAK